MGAGVRSERRIEEAMRGRRKKRRERDDGIA
jgi:hypothetical protein